jgi:hypothetical protein
MFLGFLHTMLNVKKVKHNMQLAFIKKLFTNRKIRTSVLDKILMFQKYVVQEQKLLVWYQLCLFTKSSGPFLMWQLATWNSVKCMKRCVIRKEALSRLWFGENRGWKALAPCLSKHTKSQGMLLFDLAFHPH